MNILCRRCKDVSKLLNHKNNDYYAHIKCMQIMIDCFGISFCNESAYYLVIVQVGIIGWICSFSLDCCVTACSILFILCSEFSVSV